MAQALEAVDREVPEWLRPHPWVSAQPKAAATEVATELGSLATKASTKASTKAATKAATKAQPAPPPQLAAAHARIAPPAWPAGRIRVPPVAPLPSVPSPSARPRLAQSRLVFSASSEAPTHECGFSGMQLGERAGIETAEQAVRAVMLAQARGGGQLPPEERTPLPPPPRAAAAANKPAAASRRAREEPAASHASDVPLSHSAAWRASQRMRAGERRRKEDVAPGAAGAASAEQSAAEEGAFVQTARGVMDEAYGAMDRMSRWFTG